MHGYLELQLAAELCHYVAQTYHHHTPSSQTTHNTDKLWWWVYLSTFSPMITGPVVRHLLMDEETHCWRGRTTVCVSWCTCIWLTVPPHQMWVKRWHKWLPCMYNDSWILCKNRKRLGSWLLSIHNYTKQHRLWWQNHLTFINMYSMLRRSKSV